MRNRYLGLLLFLIAFAGLYGQSSGMGLGDTTGRTTTATSLINVNYLSSILTNNGDPIRIALDKTGLLYVATPHHGKILIFSQDGSFVGSINGFKKPMSVAVDSSGKVYVGDFKDGSVSVMSPDGQFIFSLGKGKGEFGMPGDIAIAPNGYIYVTDSPNNVVKVYTPEGTFQFSFGGYGTNTGQMIFPTGITCDNTNQEIYVVDHNNGRVHVFDLNGNFKRSFGSFGSGQGKLTRPQGIYVLNGLVYVADAYQSNIEVFDRNGNFVAFIGQFGNGPGNLKVPMDVIMSGTKLFVANSDNERIEVFNVIDSQGLDITPSTLSFTTDINTNPPGQSVQVDPQVSGTSVPWTAAVSAPFIKLSQSSGIAPSSVTVNIDATALSSGVYTGNVIFRSQNGVDYPLAVNLTVLAPQRQLFVSPTSIEMFHQKNGELDTGTVSITSSGGSLQWSATTSAQWLTLSAVSGVTPSMITLSLNQDVNNLLEGIYNATVTINATNAIGSPATITVTLKTVVAGTIIVNTNLDEASFTISGPVTYTGSGTHWKTDEAKEGTYSIEFGHVKGFRRPASQSFKVKTGQSVTINGQYQPLRVANAITAAKGPDPKNDALVRVLDISGNLINQFKALATKYGAKVAMGDINGDGSDEIIVTPGPGPDNKALIKVFSYDGSELASAGPYEKTKYGADVAVGDIDGDGLAEIAVSMLSGGKKSQTVVIYSVDSSYRLIEKTRFTFQDEQSRDDGNNDEDNYYPANLTFGDVNGDGRLELILSMIDKVYIYSFDEDMSVSLVATGSISKDKKHDYKSQMTVSAGDINGDGLDEIIVGYSDDRDSVIQVLRGDMNDYGLYIKVFGKGKSAPTLSSMDWDGDGLSEILAGQGAKPDNDATLRIYGPGGTLMKEIKAFEDSMYGVNATLGVIKR